MGKVGIIVGIVMLLAIFVIYQNGYESTKEKPLDTTMSSIKYLFNEGKQAISNMNSNGMEIKCYSNEDCNMIQECNNTCICNIDDGKCYR